MTTSQEDPKPILILGSLAYDYIMDFEGDLNDNLTSDPSKGIFNLPVMPHSKNISFGGVAGNISYNLAQLGASTIIITSVGKDFVDIGYKHRLESFSTIEFKGDIHLDDHTASCYLVNDNNNNQIIIFHGGAMVKSKEIKLSTKGISKESISLALLSPDNVNAMKVWAKELEELEIPFIFDPGQVTPAFSGEDLKEIIPKAKILIGNEFEITMMCEKMGITESQMQEMNGTIIKTMGGKGSMCFTAKSQTDIPICMPVEVNDPTGAGDGFRAGLSYALTRGMDILTACKYGAAVGSFVVETFGPQTQNYSLDDIKERISKL